MPGNSGRPKKRPTNNSSNHSKYEICLKENAVVKFAFSESESFWTKTEHIKVYPIRKAKCSTCYRVGIKLLDRKHGNVVKYSQCYNTNEEAELAEWIEFAKVSELDLHPGFATNWNDILHAIESFLAKS